MKVGTKMKHKRSTWLRCAHPREPDNTRFSYDRRRPDKIGEQCLTCRHQKDTDYHKTVDGFKRRKESSWRAQGIKNFNYNTYEQMLLNQNYKCGICMNLHNEGKINRLVPDHDKLSGKVRALICSSCNLGLGKFMHNLDTLNSAIRYLQSHSG